MHDMKEIIIKRQIIVKKKNLNWTENVHAIVMLMFMLL